MKIIRYTLILLVVIASSILISHAAIVVVSPAGNGILPPINDKGAGDAIAAIIAWLIGLTAVLTVLAITWAGVQMILSTGEEEKFKKARHTMIYAFVGLLVAGLAYATVNFITNINLTNFIR